MISNYLRMFLVTNFWPGPLSNRLPYLCVCTPHHPVVECERQTTNPHFTLSGPELDVWPNNLGGYSTPFRKTIPRFSPATLGSLYCYYSSPVSYPLLSIHLHPLWLFSQKTRMLCLSITS